MEDSKQPEMTLPEALQLTEEESKQKSYAIGSISIDSMGIWHFHYIGPHQVYRKKYFGNGVVSKRNIRELFNIVGSRLNNAKDIYVEKIGEVESEQASTSENSSSDGLRDSTD